MGIDLTAGSWQADHALRYAQSVGKVPAGPIRHSKSSFAILGGLGFMLRRFLNYPVCRLRAGLRLAIDALLRPADD